MYCDINVGSKKLRQKIRLCRDVSRLFFYNVLLFTASNGNCNMLLKNGNINNSNLNI